MSAVSTVDNYQTPARRVTPLRSTMPTLVFYSRVGKTVLGAAASAKRGEYDDARWEQDSWDILESFEAIGGTVTAEGLEHVASTDEPCVIIGNHMSVFETFVLPGMVNPRNRCTFVVKKVLVDYPVFKHVMRARNPVVVGRQNPRDDLRAVLEGGAERLKQGRSIIVFPQRTRVVEFSEESFNSIGIKLAKRAGVPVIPLALKTDAWGIGWPFKDFGLIRPQIPARFAFGKPLTITGNGKEQHAEVVDFISTHLKRWSERDGTRE